MSAVYGMFSLTFSVINWIENFPSQPSSSFSSFFYNTFTLESLEISGTNLDALSHSRRARDKSLWSFWHKYFIQNVFICVLSTSITKLPNGTKTFYFAKTLIYHFGLFFLSHFFPVSHFFASRGRAVQNTVFGLSLSLFFTASFYFMWCGARTFQQHQETVAGKPAREEESLHALKHNFTLTLFLIIQPRSLGNI